MLPILTKEDQDFILAEVRRSDTHASMDWRAPSILINREAVDLLLLNAGLYFTEE